MKTYPFSALFSRMKYITRWSLMRSVRAESLSEHTADTAMLAHTLCLIGQKCTGTGAALRSEMVATAALRRYCSMLEHFTDVDKLIDAVYKLQ